MKRTVLVVLAILFVWQIEGCSTQGAQASSGSITLQGASGSSGSSGSVASADPESANLLSNPSLETANTSGTAPASFVEGQWGSHTAKFIYPATPAHTGSKALQIQMLSYSSGDAKLCTQTLAALPGQIYHFYDFYTADAQSFVTVDFHLNDGTDSWIDIATPASTGSYSNTASNVAEFVTPENTVSVTVCHGLNQVGNLTLDDFSLTQFTGFTIPPVTPPVTNNLFKNPSMESGSGSPSAWSTGRPGTNSGSFTYVTSNGFDGKRLVQATITNFTSGDAKWYPAPVAVHAGDVCTFSDTVKSNIQSLVTLAFNVGASPFYNTVATVHPSIAPQGFSYTFTVPGGASTFTAFHRIAGVGYLMVDDYKFVCNAPPQDPTFFPQGMVSLNFDDGLKQIVRSDGSTVPDQFQTIQPILDAAGMKPTMYIITGRFTFPAYDTQNQVMQMLAKGYEIGAHTRTHQDLTQMTTSQQVSEISGSRQDLFGIGADPMTFAYPFGAYNSTVVQEVMNAGYIGARTTDDAPPLIVRTDNKYTLRRMSMTDTVQESDVFSAIDQAVANREWLILLFHHVTTDTNTSENGSPYTVTPQFLQDVVNYLVQKNVRVVTNAQGIQMMQ